VSRRPPHYLGEVIHHVADDHGPLDVVDEHGGRLRTLHFGSSARQSTMFVARPQALALEYTHCMMTSLPFLAADPQRALMLGLGGGSMVKFLLHHCEACHVDVAELRPAVVEVAQDFFALPAAHERLCVHLGDAGGFIGADDTPCWDLMLMDLHTSDGMAPVVVEQSFLPSCRARLLPGGVLAANLWYGVDRIVERRVRRLLEDAFERVCYLPVAGKRNCVALGLTAPAPEAESLLGRARLWQDRTGVPLADLTSDLIRRNGLR
jgi:spermidine synthase